MATAYPSLGMTPWDLQQQEIQQELLRAQQIGQTPAPEGQMISGHYVPPSWSQQLVPILNKVLGARQQQMALDQQRQLISSMQANASNWASKLPRASQVQTQVAGPPTPAGQVPYRVNTVQPTQQDMLAWAQQGQLNPLTKGLSDKYMQDVLIDAPKRAQTQQAHRDDLAMQLQARHDDIANQTANRLQIVQMQLNNSQLDRQSRENLQREGMRLRAQLAGQANDVRMQIAATHAPQARPVPDAVVKTLRGAQQQADNMSEVLSSFKPEYGGVGGVLRKTLGTWSPVSTQDQDAAVNWWKTYENQAALTERHERFGTALSSGEQAAWRAATITPGMTPQAIQNNLATRARLAQKVYGSTRDQYIAAGYPAVADAFPIRNGAPTGTPLAPMAGTPGDIQSPGYAGGDRARANADSIKIMQMELTKPGLTDQDRTAINNEIARLIQQGAAPAEVPPVSPVTQPKIRRYNPQTGMLE